MKNAKESSGAHKLSNHGNFCNANLRSGATFFPPPTYFQYPKEVGSKDQGLAD